MATTVTSSPGNPVVYRSVVEVEPGPQRSKRVMLPAESEPVTMGFHSELAAHFGLVEGTYTPNASTLDYLVGATAACMTGVLTVALRARGIGVEEGRLRVEATGDIELEDGILVLRRIRVVIHLQADESERAAAERVAATYERQCPIYRSIRSAVDISSELDFVPVALG
jgi:uncharacterized OsmC-like protein